MPVVVRRHLLVDRTDRSLSSVFRVFRSNSSKCPVQVVREVINAERSCVLKESEQVLRFSAAIPAYYLHSFRLNLDIIQSTCLVTVVTYPAIAKILLL